MIRDMFAIGGLLALRVLGIALQLAVQVLVGRFTGPAGVGLLQVFMTWTCVLGESLACGRPAHSMKTLALPDMRSDPHRARRYLATHTKATVALWSAVLIPVVLTLTMLEESRFPLLLIAMAALCFALLRICADGLKAVGAQAASVAVENVVPPASVVILCGMLWLCGTTLDAPAAVVASVAGLAIAMVAVGILLWRRLGSPQQASPAPATGAPATGMPATGMPATGMPATGMPATGMPATGMHATGMPAAGMPAAGAPAVAAPTAELLPLWGCGLLSLLFTQFPLLAVPVFAGERDVGLFALAFKIVGLTTTVLLMLASLYGPRFACAWKADDRERAASLLGETRWVATGLLAPVLVLLSVYGDAVLRVFGEDFTAAQPYLWALLLGQFCNAATGLPGLFLNMAGAGRQEFTCLLATLALASVALPLVGPAFGAIGVALLYSGAMAGKNLASLLLARRLIEPAAPTILAETAP